MHVIVELSHCICNNNCKPLVGMWQWCNVLVNRGEQPEATWIPPFTTFYYLLPPFFFILVSRNLLLLGHWSVVKESHDQEERVNIDDHLPSSKWWQSLHLRLSTQHHFSCLYVLYHAFTLPTTIHRARCESCADKFHCHYLNSYIVLQVVLICDTPRMSCPSKKRGG